MPNPPATLEADTFTVSRSIHIDATIGAVWRAVTEPELISRWFGTAAFDGFAVGATGTLSWPDYGTIPVRIEAIDAPHVIAYRWSNDNASEHLPDEVDAATSTVFTFTLEALTPGSTRLTVVETGFEATSDPSANMDSHRSGWDYELDELVALVEAVAAGA